MIFTKWLTFHILEKEKKWILCMNFPGNREAGSCIL